MSMAPQNQQPHKWTGALNQFNANHPILSGLAGIAAPGLATAAMMLANRGQDDEDGGMSPWLMPILGGGAALGLGGMLAHRGYQLQKKGKPRVGNPNVQRTPEPMTPVLPPIPGLDPRNGGGMYGG